MVRSSFSSVTPSMALSGLANRSRRGIKTCETHRSRRISAFSASNAGRSNKFPLTQRSKNRSPSSDWPVFRIELMPSAVPEKDRPRNVTQVVEQSYDAFNRWIRRSVDADGAGSGTATDTFFAFDGSQVLLQFDGDEATDLSHRYLWGPMV